MRFLFALLTLMAAMVSPIAVSASESGSCTGAELNVWFNNPSTILACDDSAAVIAPASVSANGLTATRKMNKEDAPPSFNSPSGQTGVAYIEYAVTPSEILNYQFDYFTSKVITSISPLVYGATTNTFWHSDKSFLDAQFGVGTNGAAWINYFQTPSVDGSGNPITGPITSPLDVNSQFHGTELTSAGASATGFNGWPADANGDVYPFLIIGIPFDNSIDIVTSDVVLAVYVGSVCTKPAGCGDSGTSGDPQFVGLQGQQYQFHGMADEVFSLVSTPFLQMNSLFKFIASGNCAYNNTVCWSHPGTYLGQIAVQFGATKLLFQSAAHSVGATVIVNDRPILASTHAHIYHNGNQTLTMVYSNGEVTLSTATLYFKIVNSDYFFNMDFGVRDESIIRAGAKSLVVKGSVCETEYKSLKSQKGKIQAQLAQVYPAVPMHGLLGQTWRNAEFCGRYFEGTVDDYVTGGLFSNDHTFNFYSQ